MVLAMPHEWNIQQQQAMPLQSIYLLTQEK
jgi:hypothetical protein